MSQYTMLSKYGNCTRLLKIKSKLRIGDKVGENFRYSVSVFNKTIILLALVGYELIIANLVLYASLAIYDLISNAHSWNNCWLWLVYILLYDLHSGNKESLVYKYMLVNNRIICPDEIIHFGSSITTKFEDSSSRRWMICLIIARLCTQTCT